MLRPNNVVLIVQHCLARTPESWSWRSKGASKVLQHIWSCSPVITWREITWLTNFSTRSDVEICWSLSILFQKGFEYGEYTFENPEIPLHLPFSKSIFWTGSSSLPLLNTKENKIFLESCKVLTSRIGSYTQEPKLFFKC